MKRERTRKMSKKLVALVTALSLVLVVVVGSTVAYLIDRTNPVVNTFDLTNVDVDIVEDFDGQVKEDVQVKNTGDIPAYIRAVVVATWESDTEQGTVGETSVTAETPVEGVDFEIDYNLTDGWVKGDDGFYYYTEPLEPGYCTSNLIDTCTFLTEKDGYHLSVDILASAFQAQPSEAVESAWHVTIAPDGTLIPPGAPVENN